MVVASGCSDPHGHNDVLELGVVRQRQQHAAVGVAQRALDLWMELVSVGADWRREVESSLPGVRPVGRLPSLDVA